MLAHLNGTGRLRLITVLRGGHLERSCVP
jgi:hypothetical protein